MDKLLELDAAHQRALLLAILNSISDGVMMASDDGEFVWMNPAAHKITGLPPLESVLRDVKADGWPRVFGCYWPDGTPLAAEDLPLVKAMHGLRVVEQEMILKNEYLEKPICVAVSASPLIGVTGGVVVFRDITDRVNKEAEIQRSHDDLQQFAHIAAHDLQEPLRTVIGYLSLLNERYSGRLDEKADKYISNAVNGAARMQVLIGDLLTFSRVATKGQRFLSVDPREIINNVVADLRTTIAETGAIIEVGDLPQVIGDKGQLSQVFQNLIANAIKYCNGKPKVEISAVKDGDSCRFAVRDNGIGFDMQYADRIFMIFQRLHSRREYPGTGMGLAICRRILERHGGKIWAHSGPEGGSTFYFTIPFATQE